VIVVLTIHGIGFQPGSNLDLGHRRLCRPAPRATSNESLPVPSATTPSASPRMVVVRYMRPITFHLGAARPSLVFARLGSWTPTGSVDPTGKPWRRPARRLLMSHWLYSGLEENQGDVPALLGLETLSATSITDYESLGGPRQDAESTISRRCPSIPPATARSRRVCALEPDTTMHRGIVARLLHDVAHPTNPASSSGPAGILHTVEDDVAAYVTRNEHRERVRGFIRDAASRLIARPDVEGVVINGHSNGTVMGSIFSPPCHLCGPKCACPDHLGQSTPESTPNFSIGDATLATRDSCATVGRTSGIRWIPSQTHSRLRTAGSAPQSSRNPTAPRCLSSMTLTPGAQGDIAVSDVQVDNVREQPRRRLARAQLLGQPRVCDHGRRHSAQGLLVGHRPVGNAPTAKSPRSSEHREDRRLLAIFVLGDQHPHLRGRLRIATCGCRSFALCLAI